MSNSPVGENNNSFNNGSFNNNSFNTVWNVNNVSVDARAEILEWLSPLEPRTRHDDIRALRVQHVGGWLLRTEQYQNWSTGIHGGEPGNSALFCYGEPGVGKTYISSLVIDTLCDWAKGRNVLVACFYFDFAIRGEQSPTKILGSLLRQVVRGLEEIPAKIVQAFRDQEKAIGGRRLGLGEIVEMLQEISSSRPTFICIDALDECVAEHRAKLLDSLGQILDRSPSTRIFLAGRFHILDEVRRFLAWRVAAVSVKPTQDDIILFLRAKLRGDTTPDAMSESLEEDIIKTIPKMGSEIFLLVSLNIEAILQEPTLLRRREKLGAMTNSPDLGDAYEATIRRIEGQKPDKAKLGMAALMWISHSEQPLNVDEIRHALAVELGSTDIYADNLPSIRTVLDCCQGLVTVDEGSSTIRLIHFTLKKYLSGDTNFFGGAHSKMAETCLTYLKFQVIKDLPARRSRDPQDIPFLRYSSLYWGTHMRMGLSDRSRSLALDLLHQYDNHISAELLWKSTGERHFNSVEPFSALHCVSYFGIAEVVVDLIRTKRWDVNQRDSAGLTPLMWAAMHGHEGVVKLLLRQKPTEPDIPDTGYGRTALSWAAGSGHEEAVRLLLGPRIANRRSMRRLWRKTRWVVSPLFARKYVNPDRSDNRGQTPLSWASRNGHDGIVKLLLEGKGVSPDGPDNRGQTPLSWAARSGHDRIVKILLGQKNVSPDKPEDSGQTPLSWAARNGHGGVVKLLLGQEAVSPDKPEDNGQTPLSWAARNGHDEVVKLLLGREDVTPDRPDNFGKTPLSWAAWNGHDEVVRLLLEQENVSPDRPDMDGKTPLSLAARSGHDGVVSLLQAREAATSRAV